MDELIKLRKKVIDLERNRSLFKETEIKLQEANRQLQASEQQLKATNQQLQASEQQLKAANQQLRAANESLIASEKQYRNLFSAMREGVYLHSLVYDDQGNACNYRIIEANSISEEYLNIKREDAIGKLATDLYGTKEAPFLEIYSNVAETGEPHTFELYFEPMNKHFLTSVFSPAKGEFATAFLDITEKKEAEEKLLKNQYYLSKAQEMGKIGTWEIDLLGNQLIWTDEVYKIFGVPVGTPMNFELFLNQIHPDDREYVNKEWNKALKNKSYDIEHRLLIGDQITWVREKADIEYNDKGNAIKAIGFSQDITESKLAEKEFLDSEVRFKELVNTINSGVAIYEVINEGKSGRDYIIKEFNEFALKHEQVEKKDIIGKSLRDIRPNIDEYGLIDLFQKVWRTGEPAFFPAKVYVDEKYSNYYENRVFRLPRGEIVAIYDDVTEREHATAQIKESQERFDLAMKASKDGLYDWNLSTNEIYYSPGWKSMLGYGEEELPNDFTVWEKLTEAKDVERSWEMQQELISKQRDRFEIEFKMKHKDGHWVDILSRAEAIFDEKGKASRIIGTHIDISERKQTESDLIKAKEKAEESEHRFRFLAENSQDMIYRMSIPEAVYEYVSPASIEIFGYTPAEFYNTPLLIKKVLHPNWEEYFNNEWQNLLDGINPPSYEYQITHKSGEVRWLNQRNSLIKDENGKPIAVEGAVTDITERKHVEEVLLAEKLFSESLISSLPGVFYLISEQMRFLRWNKKFEVVTGRSAEEMARISPMDLFEDEDKQAIATAIQKVFTHGQVEVRARFVAKDGKRIPYQFSGDKIVVDGTTNLIGLGLDITEQQQVEIELVASKEKAEESDRLKSAFLANMSHEIRTPMNGILGFSNLLKKPTLTGQQQKKYVDIIEKSGVRMLNIINDIIDISKIEAGLMKLEISESNINEQIEYIYTFFKPEVDAKGMKLSFKNTLPSKEAIIKTDREKVYAILTNLVKNAIKYTDKGSIEFGYTTKGDCMEFFVRDTGIGIPNDRQAAIFERFIQADISDAQARQGAGLGLSISKAYVEMLNGKIWLVSEEGKGSTFYFSIPINKAAEKDPDLDSIDVDDDSHKLDLKVLIVEDDEASSQLISIIVEKYQKETISLIDGEEAVEVCRNNPDIDLILLDIQIPGINGYEVTRQIREFNKEVIIIAQTAYGLSGDREIALKAGCNDYISKPINEGEFGALIRKYFRK